MARNPSVQETVARVMAEADAGYVVKTAARSPETPLSPMAKLAQALREAPDLELTFDVLHVVKTAMVRGVPLEIPAFQPHPDDGNPLRKVANALRAEDHEAHQALLAKGAHALKAERGLMLLRELVRE